MGNNYSRFGTSFINSSKQDCITKDNMHLELNTNSVKNKNIEDNNLDPRSPSVAICRTPIDEFLGKRNTEYNKFGISPNTAAALKDYENPQRILKTKILKGLNEKKLIDPRSPNQFINRTPIVFDENTMNDDSECDTSFNLNDTFSDLFISNTKNTLSSNDHDDNDDDGNKENQNKLKHIMNLPFNKIDPRSPTLGVDRTPIIFSDDDDNNKDNDENLNEDIMIENLLDSIKMNSNTTDNKKVTEKLDKKSKKIFNRIINENSMNIYEDQDIDQKMISTPKRQIQNEQMNLLKRTPLSCMRNSHNIEKNVDMMKQQQHTKKKFGLNNLTILKNSVVEAEKNKNPTIEI